MKTLLLNPKFPDFSYNLVIRSNRIWQPISLGQIASLLEKEGYHFSLVDANALGLAHNQIIKLIDRYSPDILVLNTTPHDRWQNPIPSTEHLAHLAKDFVNLKKKPVVVLVGYYGTVWPEQTLQEIPNSDFVVRGEPEITTFELIKNIISGRPDSTLGVSYIKNGSVFSTANRLFLDNLDLLPLPAYHLMPMDRYYYNKQQRTDKNHKFAMVITSRGCPMRCEFCNLTMLGDKYRVRTIENVIQEIDILVSKHGVNFIMFHDQILTLNKARLLKFCESLIERDFQLKWTCQSRAQDLQIDLLNKMQQAGCISIGIGIEAGTEQVQQNLKHAHLHSIVNLIEKCRRVGIAVYAGHLLGLPGQTKSSILTSAKFFKRLKLPFDITTITTPYPGTKYYENGRQEGKIKDDSWISVLTAGGQIGNDLDMKILKRLSRRLTLENGIYQTFRRIKYVVKNPNISTCKKIIDYARRRRVAAR